MTDLARVVRALADAGVEFIIFGGLAANVHGSARVTTDVDAVYSRARANLVRIVNALKPLKPYLRGAAPRAPLHVAC